MSWINEVVKKETPLKRPRLDECVADVFSRKRIKREPLPAYEAPKKKAIAKPRAARKRTPFNRKKASSSMRRAGSCVTEIEGAEFGGKSFVQATNEHKEALNCILVQLDGVQREFKEPSRAYIEELSTLMNLSVRRYTRIQNDTPEKHQELFNSHANLARKTAAMETALKKTQENLEAVKKTLEKEIEKTRSLSMHYWQTQQNQLAVMEGYAYRRPLFRRKDIEGRQPPMIQTPFTYEDGQAVAPFV